MPALRTLLAAALAGLLFVLAVVSPAMARNVPGSASVAQSAVDQAMGSSILDSLLAMRDSRMCEDYLDTPRNGKREEPCTLGFAIGGGALALQDAPDGYKFDYSAAYSTMILSQKLSDGTVVFGGVLGEAGSGVLDYNDGTLSHYGAGPVLGASFDTGGGTRFAVVGSAEWLRYNTTRSNGLYEGEYDAARLMAGARLSGVLEQDWFFLEYGGDLRLIHQENSAYTEYSLGSVFAEVDATSFTTLTAIGNLKLGVPMGTLTPYAEATGYLGLYQDGDMNTVGIDDQLTGRVGVGLSADLLGGTLSLRTGAYFDGDGYKGLDAGFNFGGRF